MKCSHKIIHFQLKLAYATSVEWYTNQRKLHKLMYALLKEIYFENFTLGVDG